MENNKAALAIIIVLLAISIPCSVIGIVYKVKLANKPATSTTVTPSRKFFEDGKLNFYEYENLIGQYTCKNPNGYCGWALETFDDTNYSLSVYKDGSIDYITLVSSRFAFLVDSPDIKEDYSNDNVILYDAVEAREVKTYKAVKNYTIGLNNNYYIVKDETEKWGVIQLSSEGFAEVIPYEYDYIGLKNDINPSTEKLVSNKFVVQKEGEWYIIDLNNTQLSKPIASSIIDYKDNSMIVFYYSRYSLYDYEAINQFENQAFKYMNYVKDYVGYIDADGDYGIYNPTEGTMVSKDKYPLSNVSDLQLLYNEDGSVDISISGEFKETIN